mgnify:CR=1 FL=1
MKKEIRSDMLLLVLNLVAIFFIVNTGIFSVQIPVGNFYIYLFICCLVLKNYIHRKCQQNAILNTINISTRKCIYLF